MISWVLVYSWSCVTITKSTSEHFHHPQIDLLLNNLECGELTIQDRGRRETSQEVLRPSGLGEKFQVRSYSSTRGVESGWFGALF